jgi:hypothetical protein
VIKEATRYSPASDRSLALPRCAAPRMPHFVVVRIILANGRLYLCVTNAPFLSIVFGMHLAHVISRPFIAGSHHW